MLTRFECSQAPLIYSNYSAIVSRFERFHHTSKSHNRDYNEVAAFFDDFNIAMPYPGANRNFCDPMTIR